MRVVHFNKEATSTCFRTRILETLSLKTYAVSDSILNEICFFDPFNMNSSLTSGYQSINFKTINLDVVQFNASFLFQN